MIEVLKHVTNRYLFYHRKLRRNPSIPIYVNYESLKSYFEDHQSYDRAQKSLDKLNKAIVEEDYYSDVSEPYSSNSDHNFEVIDKSNPTLERLEDGSYGRRSKFICNIDYFCILLLMKFS